MDMSLRAKSLHQFVEFIYDTQEPDKAAAREKIAKQVISVFCGRGYDYEIGSTRITFIGGNFVYKVPRWFGGVRANLNEATYYRSEGKKFPVAACRIIYLDDDKLLPILIMERVEPLRYGSQKPEWANRVDGGQVGMNRKGEIVAYDL